MGNTGDVLRKLEASFGGNDGNILPAKSGNKVMDRLATALWLGEKGKDWYDKASERHTNRTTWTVKVDEADSIYRQVEDWIMADMPKEDIRNIVASSSTVFVDANGKEKKPSTSFLSDSYGEPSSTAGGHTETRIIVGLGQAFENEIVIDGHKVKVRVSSGDEGESDDERSGGRHRSYRGGGRSKNVTRGSIIFYTRSLEGQNAIVAKLNAMVSGPHKRTPSLWVADGWGQWRSQEAPQRRLESVVLAEGVKEDLMSDLRKFIADEQRYADLGIPWHRGYLFHGPAGTGKTSLIKALAAELGLDLWYAPLGDLKEDSSLVDLVRSVRPRGILLLEDVDAYAAARDREQDHDAGTGVTTSALLNALDGVVTPHGLITIMTTNHLKKLDPALVRSGRADRTVKLDLPGWGEVQTLWSMFFPNQEKLGDKPDGFKKAKISQASISEVFKRWWDEPDKARDELMSMFGE